MTDRSVNAAIWFGLEQISDAFWGQNNPALPICGGKRTVRSTAKYFRSKKKKKERNEERSYREREKNNMVVGGWKKELNRLVSSEAVFQTASAAKVSCCLFTRNNESISRARLWAPLQLYSITASHSRGLELKVSRENGGYMLKL